MSHCTRSGTILKPERIQIRSRSLAGGVCCRGSAGWRLARLGTNRDGCQCGASCIVALSAAFCIASAGLRHLAPDATIAAESTANGSSSGSARSRNVPTRIVPLFNAAPAPAASPAPKADMRRPRLLLSASMSAMKSRSYAQSQATAMSIFSAIVSLIPPQTNRVQYRKPVPVSRPACNSDG